MPIVVGEYLLFSITNVVVDVLMLENAFVEEEEVIQAAVQLIRYLHIGEGDAWLAGKTLNFAIVMLSEHCTKYCLPAKT